MSQPQVLSDLQVAERYGHFQWKPNGGRSIVIQNDWVEKNITTVYIPQLKGVDTYGATFSGRVRWHKNGVEQLQRAWAEVEDEGYLKDVIQWGGSFVPRRKVGGNSLSHHSWGIAFDINVEWNNWLETPAAKGKKGSVLRLVPIFEKHGFAWGGRWKTKDGMHFEIAETRKYDQVNENHDATLLIAGKKPIDLMLRDGVSYAELSELAKAIGDDDVEINHWVPVASYLRSHGYKITWDATKKQVIASK